MDLRVFSIIRLVREPDVHPFWFRNGRRIMNAAVSIKILVGPLFVRFIDSHGASVFPNAVRSGDRKHVSGSFQRHCCSVIRKIIIIQHPEFCVGSECISGFPLVRESDISSV